MSDWYESIEEPIRELVRLLRNNGFNTYSSCSHKKIVEMEWYGYEEEVRALYNLLFDNGYNNFELHIIWPSSGIGRFMELRINEN
jgi:hypothetical protein